MQKTKKSNPIGNSIVGSVFDVNKKYLLRAMQDYDPQLYLKWNARKNDGIGLWEVRRRPTKKTAVQKTVWDGAKVFTLEYVEQDLVHHVMDVPYLNYHILTRLKEMDTFTNKNWLDDGDYEAERAYDAERAKLRAERKYAIRHEKKYLKALREEMLSGGNILRHFKDWK